MCVELCVGKLASTSAASSLDRVSITWTALRRTSLNAWSVGLTSGRSLRVAREVTVILAVLWMLW